MKAKKHDSLDALLNWYKTNMPGVSQVHVLLSAEELKAIGAKKIGDKWYYRDFELVT